jgi:signal transduction histidine kinase
MSGQAPGRRLLRLATLRTANGAVLAAVEDSGSGLDAIQASRIFEPFFTTKRDGMGLGLAICQTIVETHGGKLWMMPRVPRGCSFQFELPPANSG